MKDEVLKIVKSNLFTFEGILAMEGPNFKAMSENQLEEKYPYANCTYGERLSQLQDKVSELRRCVAWVESSK